MLVQEVKIRVRYAETDQMGYVYYGNYATYYEVARAESLRSLGFSYKLLEEQGVTVVFGYPGGAILPFYDALYKSKICSR